MINLLKGEKLILKLKPLKKVKPYWMLKDTLTSMLFIAIFVPMVCLMFLALLHEGNVFNFSFGKFLPLAVISPTLIMTFCMVYINITNTLRYKKLHYWITNKRIIIRKGLIGYSQKSLLLERIGEITVSQTYLQRLYGIKILKLEVIGTGRRTEILPGFPNTEKNKQLLLELITKKRKNEGLTY